MQVSASIKSISMLKAVQAQPQHIAAKAQSASWLVAGTVAASLFIATTPAIAADLALGQEVFENNCAACHTGGYNSVQVEKTLRKSDLEMYLAGGFNIEAIEYQVENGKNAMPAWGDWLSEEEIQGVAAYVFDQASGDKW